MSDATALVPFGWHGIEIRVPASWELSRFSGDYNAGYAALDDGVQVRLQMRWARAGRGIRSGTQLDRALLRYQRSLAKASRSALVFQLDAADSVQDWAATGREAVVFRWEDDQTAYGMAWHCRECRRTAIVEALFPKGHDEKIVAQRILKSAVDHRSDGLSLWAAYGFEFLAPAAYRLQESELVAGRQCFVLREARCSWLRVERWALAAQWMAKTSLDQWPGELLKLMRLSSRIPPGLSDREIRGHPARGFTLEVRRGIGRRTRVEGVVWVCPDDDKVFAVTAGGGPAGRAEQVAATVACR